MGAPFGWMEAVIPPLPPAARFTASAIPCTSCEALTDEPCSGPRVCPERLGQAVDMIRRGELPEAPERVPEAPEACRECGTATNPKGDALACANPLHRCHRILRTNRKQCRRAVVPGTRYCEAHPANAVTDFNGPLK